MHINEVENMVGLSKKSIRYYEEMGLIKPSRESENDYRIYTNNDIRKLKIIKFLRELDVPIKELQDLEKDNISLEECMRDRIKKIDELLEKYKKINNMCVDIIDSGSSYENIEIDNYFRNVRVLNKEGFTMRNVKISKTKKIIGAIIPSILFGGFFIGIIVGFSYLYFYAGDFPLLAYLLLVGVMSIFVFGILYNFIIRIKEILGGEEDEASKY